MGSIPYLGPVFSFLYSVFSFGSFSSSFSSSSSIFLHRIETKGQRPDYEDENEEGDDLGLKNLE
jgi:hypothetical protein